MTGSSKRVLAASLAAVMVFSLAACGNTEGGDDDRKLPEWVYVPEYRELEEEGSYYSAKQVGDALYYQFGSFDEEKGTYVAGLRKYSLADGSAETLLEMGDASINQFEVAGDGSIYAMSSEWLPSDTNPEEYEVKYLLMKYGPSGDEVFRQDITEATQENSIDYINNMVVDDQNRVCLFGNSDALVFDGEGAFQGVIKVSDGMGGINDVIKGKDGKIYSYGWSSGGEGGYVLSEVDIDKRAVVNTYANFPGGNGLTAGSEHDFLSYDSSGVYGYTLADQSAEKLFDWVDSDITGEYVQSIGIIEDGRILVVINDWGTSENSLALLSKTPGSEVPQKEIILVGTMSASQELRSAAVKFNKTSDKYRISIKEYIDNTAQWTETTWSDALTRLNNDITSGNCPDLIDAGDIDIQQLTSKGVIEDLTPFLENSTVLKREDFLEPVLNGFTYEGVLAGIPKTFNIQTVAGSSKDLGTEMGWSLEEIIAYSDAHPDASLFDYTSKSNVMYYCMRYNEGAFVDWSTGKCNFNSPEFISLLEFVNRFPEEADYNNDVSAPNRIQRGEVLLDTVYLDGFNEVQMYNEIFGGQAVFIGYPTTDGSVGCALNASNVYAIAAKSKMKDGAWAFLESYLAQENTDRWSWGFPSNKEQLDKKIQEAIKVETYTWVDEDGVEHEEVSSGGGSVSYEDGWTYEYHTTTQEEVDQVLALIEVARPTVSQNSNVMAIIAEEAEAFYKGQKSAAEVADVIQRRIQNYVDENR